MWGPGHPPPTSHRTEGAAAWVPSQPRKGFACPPPGPSQCPAGGQGGRCHETGLEPQSHALRTRPGAHSGQRVEDTAWASSSPTAPLRGGGRGFWLGPSAAPSTCWGVRGTACAHIPPPPPDHTALCLCGQPGRGPGCTWPPILAILADMDGPRGGGSLTRGLRSFPGGAADAPPLGRRGGGGRAVRGRGQGPAGRRLAPSAQPCSVSGAGSPELFSSEEGATAEVSFPFATQLPFRNTAATCWWAVRAPGLRGFPPCRGAVPHSRGLARPWYFPQNLTPAPVKRGQERSPCLSDHHRRLRLEGSLLGRRGLCSRCYPILYLPSSAQNRDGPRVCGSPGRERSRGPVVSLHPLSC